MTDPAYLKTCNCGNKYIATGKPTCPNCILIVKMATWDRLADEREVRRKAKAAKRQSKKQGSL